MCARFTSHSRPTARAAPFKLWLARISESAAGTSPGERSSRSSPSLSADDCACASSRNTPNISESRGSGLARETAAGAEGAGARAEPPFEKSDSSAAEISASLSAMEPGMRSGETSAHSDRIPTARATSGLEAAAAMSSENAASSFAARAAYLPKPSILAAERRDFAAEDALAPSSDGSAARIFATAPRASPENSESMERSALIGGSLLSRGRTGRSLSPRIWRLQSRKSCPQIPRATFQE